MAWIDTIIDKVFGVMIASVTLAQKRADVEALVIRIAAGQTIKASDLPDWLVKEMEADKMIISDPAFNDWLLAKGRSLDDQIVAEEGSSPPPPQVRPATGPLKGSAGIKVPPAKQPPKK